MKLQARGFCKISVTIVATAHCHTSQELNSKAYSLEAFKCCYSCDSHKNSPACCFLPERILTNIFEILNIRIVPEVRKPAFSA
jgi:hypothetical protein